MLTLRVDQLPVDEPTLRAAVAEYQAALEAHKLTVDVPAPWPAYEVLREIIAAGGEFEVLYPPPPSAREMALNALAQKREAEAKLAVDRMLAAAALEPDAPLEVVDYVAAHPEIAALAPDTSEQI